jgi:hypothetical protein
MIATRQKLDFGEIGGRKGVTLRCIRQLAWDGD